MNENQVRTGNKYCTTCGSVLRAEARFCPTCGVSVPAERKLIRVVSHRNRWDSNTRNNNGKKVRNFTEHFTEEDRKSNRFLAAIGYIPILFIFPILKKNKSDFCHFHGNQAFMTFTLHVAFMLLVSIFASTFFVISAFIAFINLSQLILEVASTILLLIVIIPNIFFVVCYIVGFITSMCKKAIKLPIVGSFSLF